MQDDSQITITALVARPVEQVWKVWTDPGHIVQWCAASDDWHCPKASNDLRRGGRFSTTMAARDGSHSFDFEGVYDMVVPQRRIDYTLADGRRCEIRFNSEPGGTRVVQTFDAEQQHSAEMQRSGWQAILDRFKTHAEAQ